ncbi:hypothetical protein L6452_42472 [Arctium lappa]|uniref:Uncharacterized protein n=1 Tax=Arctium lappa TaxID=4217 RepID=A0ACB8XHV4_ARCLA|nr:hypothetical protein L6452_42472 [Arctium lappa]
MPPPLLISLKGIAKAHLSNFGEKTIITVYAYQSQLHRFIQQLSLVLASPRLTIEINSNSKVWLTIESLKQLI